MTDVPEDVLVLLRQIETRLGGICPPAERGKVRQEEWALLANVLRSAAEACRRLAGNAQVVEAED